MLKREDGMPVRGCGAAAFAPRLLGATVQLASKPEELWVVEKLRAGRAMLRLVGGTETKWTFIRLYRQVH